PPGAPAVVATTAANPLPNCRSSAPAANGVHSTPQTPPFAPGAGAPTKPAQATPNPPPVGAAPPLRTARTARLRANPCAPGPGAPTKPAQATPHPTTRRSSAPAANGVHSTPRARNGGPLEATLPKPDRDPLQLLRRRFGTQSQVFADSPPARGGQVAPLTQGLKHTELLPLGCQLTG